MGAKKLLLISLTVLVIIGTTPTWAIMNMGPNGLELDGEVIGTAIEEEEMDDLRGGYLGISFSILFEGFWDSLGNYNANLITNGNTGSGSAGTTIPPDALPPNTSVLIEAQIGNLGGGNKGVFTYTLVPGSGNIINTTLQINIQILQVLGNTVPTIINYFK